MKPRWVAAGLLAFAGWSAAPLAQPSMTTIRPDAAQPPAPPPSLIGDDDSEARLWRRIRDSEDGRDFEAFLRQYPSGTNAPQARERLAALQRRGVAAPAPPAPPPPPSGAPPSALLREAPPTQGVREALDHERARNESAAAQLRLPPIYDPQPAPARAAAAPPVPAPRQPPAAAPATPAAGRTYSVVATANIREQPNPSSPRIGNVVAGETVSVIGRANAAWLQVERNGRQGFVIARALTPDTGAAEPAPPRPASRPDAVAARAELPAAPPPPAAVEPPARVAAAPAARAALPGSAFLADAALRARGIIEEPGRSDPERMARFRALFLDSVFDVGAMAQVILGAAAARYRPAQIDDFIQALGDYMVFAYWANLRTSFGWQMDIGTARLPNARGAAAIADWAQVADGEPVTIETMVTSIGGLRTPVQWQVVRHGERWHIVDVATLGVSLVRLHRDDIGSQLQQSGNDLPRLTVTLREKAQALSREPAPLPLPPPTSDEP